MSSIAMGMLILALVLVWGGMVLSIFHLMRNPDETSGELGDEPILNDY